jgi:hypothetical protein
VVATLLTLSVGLCPAERHEVTLGDGAMIDLGDVWAGAQISLEINLINPGTEDYRVRNVTTSCGCTVMQTSLDVIPAGSSAEIFATFQAPAHATRKTARIRLMPEEGGGSRFDVTLTANVVQAAELEPLLLAFRPVTVGDVVTPETKTIELVSRNDEPLAILGVTASPEGVFKVVSSPDVVEPGARAVIEVEWTAPDEVGLSEGVLSVRLDHEQMPALTTPLRGNVLGEITVTPTRVWFGTVAQGNTMRRPLRISSSLEGFEVGEISIDSPGITAEVARIAAGVCDLVVTFDSTDVNHGVINTELHVRTNSPRQPELSIRVGGIVRAR